MDINIESGFNGFYQVVILAQRAKHPRQSVKSVFEKKLGGDETNTDSTDFIRDGVQSKKDFKHTTFRYPLNKSGMVTTAWITSE